MWTRSHLSIILLPLVLQPYILSQPADKYMYASLEKFCHKDGSKREVRFLTKPHMYVFNSSLSSTFQCHLEFEHTSRSPGSGFSIHIHTMDFNGPRDKCSSDWIQFGKDFLFVTTEKSKRFCGKIEPLVSIKKDQLPSGFEPDPYKDRRNYRETAAEMDLWIKISPGREKKLVLIVTPHVSCTKQSKQYRACPNSPECVPNDLFCDGKVNCISNNLDEDSRFCTNLEPGGIVESSLGIPLMIIICVVVVIFIVFSFFVVKEGIKRLQTFSREPSPGRGQLRTHVDTRVANRTVDGQNRGVIGLREEFRDRLVDEDRPQNPPPYSEVIKDQPPPKYSEIEKIDTSV